MIKLFFTYLLSVFMIGAGVSHFTSPDGFVRIVPSYLPYPLELVYISGFFEVLGGVGILFKRLRQASAWGLIALYIAVFPANVNMAIHQISMSGSPVPEYLLWLRLPLQLLLIFWAFKISRPEKVHAQHT